MRGQPTKQINAAQFVLMSKPWRTATITVSKLQTANTRSIGCPSKEFVSANGTSYVDLTFQQVNQLPIWSVQKLDDV